MHYFRTRSAVQSPNRDPPFPPCVVSSWVIWCMIPLHKSFLLTSTSNFWGIFFFREKIWFALCRIHEVTLFNVFLWHIQLVRSVWTWSQSQYSLQEDVFSWKPKCVRCCETPEKLHISPGGHQRPFLFPLCCCSFFCCLIITSQSISPGLWTTGQLRYICLASNCVFVFLFCFVKESSL